MWLGSRLLLSASATKTSPQLRCSPAVVPPTDGGPSVNSSACVYSVILSPFWYAFHAIYNTSSVTLARLNWPERPSTTACSVTAESGVPYQFTPSTLAQYLRASRSTATPHRLPTVVGTLRIRRVT